MAFITIITEEGNLKLLHLVTQTSAFITGIREVTRANNKGVSVSFNAFILSPTS